MTDQERVVVIGAGMAGLAAAIELAGGGIPVTLFEKQPYPGGKMRALNGVDSGPTVFTMPHVFDGLFGRADLNFRDYVTLHSCESLARHAWQAGDCFDLFVDIDRSAEEIMQFSDRRNAEGYKRLCQDAGEIYGLLKDSFMNVAKPNPLQLGASFGFNPLTAMKLKPMTSLWSALGKYFTDPRLHQLFGRYATYVGSSPFQAPATLMLIAYVEQEGVHLVAGGMHALAKGMLKAAEDLGVAVHLGDGIERITRTGGSFEVVSQAGLSCAAKSILFAGDASALGRGYLGQDVTRALPPVVPEKRALSAITWSLTTPTSGFPLARHNVFFGGDYANEFESIFKQRRQADDPTIYVCAQDRDDIGRREDGGDAGGAERLLILTNAPADGDSVQFDDDQRAKVRDSVAKRLSACGLEIADWSPQAGTMTTPAEFEGLFPGSGGSLYGRASHGWRASFERPGNRSSIDGLYLAGGSVHPGAGVPMATTSGAIAAQQLLKDWGVIRG